MTKGLGSWALLPTTRRRGARNVRAAIRPAHATIQSGQGCDTALGGVPRYGHDARGLGVHCARRLGVLARSNWTVCAHSALIQFLDSVLFLSSQNFSKK